MTRMGCRVTVNQHGKLTFRFRWNRKDFWEGTSLEDTPDNRKVVEGHAIEISREIEKETFDYLTWFPEGNKAHLFRPQEEPKEEPAPRGPDPGGATQVVLQALSPQAGAAVGRLLAVRRSDRRGGARGVRCEHDLLGLAQRGPLRRYLGSRRLGGVIQRDFQSALESLRSRRNHDLHGAHLPDPL